jgi:hypothetical protein
MEKRYFGILKHSTFMELRYMALRTFLLAFLTIVGFSVLDYLVQSGRADSFALVHRFPEFITMMDAAAKFTFIDMSLYWIRFGTQVRNDKREALSIANSTPSSAAFVYFTNALSNIFRVCVFLYLMST